MHFRNEDSDKNDDSEQALIPANRPIGQRRRGYLSLLAIGAIAAVIGLALLPAQETAAREIREGGSCSDTYDGCHSGAQTPSMMTVTGLPVGNYVPGQQYTVHIVIADSNTDTTGYNSFDLLIDAGSLSTTDPDVEINNINGEASANDAADLMKATMFDVVWTAPMSGSANIEIWAVMGDGAQNTLDIWDRESFSYNSIPEFPMVLLPVVGIGLAVVIASRLSKKM